MWAKLLGGAVSWASSAKYYLIGGAFTALLAFSGIQGLQIKRAEAVKVTLEQTVTELRVADALRANIVASQKGDIDRLIAMVDECEQVKEALRNTSQLILAELTHTKESQRQTTEKNKKRVEEALVDETCTDIAIPSDASRVLRAGAASANSDRAVQ